MDPSGLADIATEAPEKYTLGWETKTTTVNGKQYNVINITDVLKSVKSQLAADTTMSQEEKDIRYQIVAAACTAAMRAPASGESEHRDDNWTSDGDGPYHLRKPNLSRALEEIWGVTSKARNNFKLLLKIQTVTGCKKAAQLDILRAFSQYFMMHPQMPATGGLPTGTRFDNVVGIIPPGDLLPTDKGGQFTQAPIKTGAAGFSEKQFLPGDWLWMPNPYYDNSGNAEDGANVIYAGQYNGEGLFISAYGAEAYNYQGLVQHVKAFDSVSGAMADGKNVTDPDFTIQRIIRPKLPSQVLR